MIWSPEWDSRQGESPMVSDLTAEIEALCGADMPLSEDQVLELARAVAAFIENECSGVYRDPESLMMLASRALASLGARQVARRLIIKGTGLLRPSEWEVTGEEAMWVLDLRQITLQHGAPLELVFFHCLRLVLESMGEVWDATKGAGVLGLRHVTMSAASLLGGGRSGKDVDKLATEIKDVCRARLGLIRKARGWDGTPFVMDLDI
jgi:hypothetical protein